MRHLLAVAIVLLAAPFARAAWVDAQGVTYNLLTPKDYDSKKIYRLVVAVHGRNGTGSFADSEAKAFWARNHDVIVAGPNMPWGTGEGKDKSKDGHAAMEALLKDARKKHKLHDKIVLLGFSQGGYYAPTYATGREDQLLMMSIYGAAAPGYAPKNLPVAGACGSQETFGPGLKAWAEKINGAGGFAVHHIAEGAGHTVTESMRKMTVDLYEKCFKGLAPRVLEQVEAKFDEAKKLEESSKFKDAAGRYKSILATKSLPDDLKAQARDGQTKAILGDMARTNPKISETWESSRAAILAALKEFPGVLPFRKLLDDSRKSFRGTELDSFFVQAETASQVISHLTLHQKDVDAAAAKNPAAVGGAKGPSQKALNRKLLPLLEKIDDAQIRATLEPHLAKLAEPVS